MKLTYTKPVGLGEMAQCEDAKQARCFCRCGGILHGLDHTQYALLFNEHLELHGSIDFDVAADLAWVSFQQHHGEPQ